MKANPMEWDPWMWWILLALMGILSIVSPEFRSAAAAAILSIK